MKIDGVNILEGSSISNAVLPSGIAFPSNPSLGELYYNTQAPNIGTYVYDGSAWITLAGGGGGSTTVEMLGLENVDNTSDLDKPISNATAAALDLKVNYTDIGIVTIKNINGNYTLVQEDIINTMIRINSPNSITSTVTIPNDTVLSGPIGSTITIASSGNGPVQLVAGAGTSIRTPQSLIIERKYGRVVLVKVDTNTWEVDGQLRPQEQILINPINLIAYYNSLHYSTSDPLTNPVVVTPGDDVQLIRELFIYDTQIYGANSFWNETRGAPLDGNIHADWAPQGTNLFSNISVNGKYVRATKLSGTGEIAEPGTSYKNYNSNRTYYPEGQWFLLNDTQHRWALGPVAYDEQDEIEIRIDISDSKSDADILGYFTVSYVGTDVVRLDWFKAPNFANDVKMAAGRINISTSYIEQLEGFGQMTDSNINYLFNMNGPTYWQNQAGFRFQVLTPALNDQQYFSPNILIDSNYAFSGVEPQILFLDRANGPVQIKVILESNAFGPMTQWTEGTLWLAVNTENWIAQEIQSAPTADTTYETTVTVNNVGQFRTGSDQFIANISPNTKYLTYPSDGFCMNRARIKVSIDPLNSVGTASDYTGNIPLDTLTQWASGTADTISLSSGIETTFIVEIYIDAHVGGVDIENHKVSEFTFGMGF